jgi:gamma-glutamyltranspeptidase/glutathione hydrolase
MLLGAALQGMNGAWAQTLSRSTNERAALGSTAMVATAHPLASEAAVAMLQRGGNAVDAAVAAAFTIGVVEPDGSGLGGGGGILVYLAREQKPVYINYYPRASSLASRSGYTTRVDAQTAKAILVPGAVAGLTLVLEKYGTLPLAVVMAPAIRHAEKGFPIDATLAKIILDHVPLIEKNEATASVYLRDGFPMVEGETLVQPELAATLKVIAQRGRAGFYEGDVARTLIDGITAAGGRMTAEDLRTCTADVLEPVHSTYRGTEVISAPPPHSGAIVIEALHIMEHVDLATLGHFSGSTDAMHLAAEVLRRVYADRTAWLADPRFESVPVSGLLSRAYAAARFADINPEAADPREYRKTRAGDPVPYATGTTETLHSDQPGQAGGRPDHCGGRERTAKPAEDRKPVRQADSTRRVITPKVPEPESRLEYHAPPDAPRMAASAGLAEEPLDRDGHTTHLGIMDGEGNVVALTQTLGTFFGSGVTVGGVLMNNAMSNFAGTTARNAIEPGKQPRSSIAPTIVLKDGRPFLSVGSPGATRIIATVVELLVNTIDHDMPAHEANAAPRFLCQKADDYLHLESRIAEKVQDGMRQRGHSLQVYGPYDLFFGGAQIIRRDPRTGQLEGSADPRRGGMAIGY